MAESATHARQPAGIPPLRLLSRVLRLAWLLLVALILVPVTPVIGHKRSPRIVRWWYKRMLRALDIAVHVHGDMPKQPVLIAANHCSWLDILVLGHVFNAAFISKAEVARWPVIGVYARATGTVFLARGAYRIDDARAQIRAAFARHLSVVLFPEGTTSTTPSPARFHARLFSGALDGKHPVLPVALRYSDAATPAGAHHPLVPWVDMPLLTNFVHILRLQGLRAEVRVCALIRAEGHTRRSLAEASRAAIGRQAQPQPSAVDACDSV